MRRGSLSVTPFLVTGVVVPAVSTEEADDALLDRMHVVDGIMALLDRLFATFLQFRLAPVWSEAWETAVAA